MLKDLRKHLKGMTKQQVLDFIAGKNSERVLSGFEKASLLFDREMSLTAIEKAWKAGELKKFGLDIQEGHLEWAFLGKRTVDIFNLDTALTGYYKEHPEKVLAFWEGNGGG